MKKSIFPMAVLFILLGGCISIPLPDGPQDALLVIPCEITDFKNEKWIAKQVEVILQDTETDQEYRVKLSSNQDYLTITLPSRPYIMERVLLTVAERGIGKFEVKEAMLSPVAFFLEKNVVFFARYTLHFENGEEGFVLRTSRNQSAERARDIYEKLKQEYFWAAWKGYPLIGLDESEG